MKITIDTIRIQSRNRNCGKNAIEASVRTPTTSADPPGPARPATAPHEGEGGGNDHRAEPDGTRRVHDPADVACGVDQFGVHTVLVGVIAHRPDPRVQRDRRKRQGRIDTAADADDAGEDSLAVDHAHGSTQRGDEPQQAEDSQRDHDPPDVDAVTVAAVGIPLDDLCRSVVPVRRAAEEHDRPDDEEDDVQQAAQNGPARHATRAGGSDCSFHGTSS